MLFQIVDEMYLIWDANTISDRAQKLVKEAFDKHVNYNITEL